MNARRRWIASRGGLTGGRRSAAAGFGAIALLAALGGTSIAGEGAQTAKEPKAHTKVQQVTLPGQVPPHSSTADGVAQFNVNCPAQTTLVGGGGLAGTNSSGDFWLEESGPVGNGWQVRYNNFDFTDTPPASFLPVSDHAICLKNKLKVRPPKPFFPQQPNRKRRLSASVIAQTAKSPKARTKIHQVTQYRQVPERLAGASFDTEAEFNVNCPTGTTVVSGGGLYGPGVLAALVLVDSGPEGNGWHVQYRNDLGGPYLVSGHAICLGNKLKVRGRSVGLRMAGEVAQAARKPKAHTKIQQVTLPVRVPARHQAEFNVNCPAHTTLVGGGGLIGPTPDTNLLESGPVGNGWQVRFHGGIVDANAATVHAICLKNKLNVK